MKLKILLCLFSAKLWHTFANILMHKRLETYHLTEKKNGVVVNIIAHGLTELVSHDGLWDYCISAFSERSCMISVYKKVGELVGFLQCYIE